MQNLFLFIYIHFKQQRTFDKPSRDSTGLVACQSLYMALSLIITVTTENGLSVSKIFFLFKMFSAPGLNHQDLPPLDGNIHDDQQIDNNAIKLQIQSDSIFLPHY
jgi:hypothetical protein